MDNKEYIIINKTAIQKRIEELEWSLSNISESYIPKHEAQIYALKQILSQSTPLIPEIKKAFDAGNSYCIGSHELFEQTYPNKKEYISNLKLDI
jgi:hypothetical protein